MTLHVVPASVGARVRSRPAHQDWRRLDGVWQKGAGAHRGR
jgi:hypothetical protein